MMIAAAAVNPASVYASTRIQSTLMPARRAASRLPPIA